MSTTTTSAKPAKTNWADYLYAAINGAEGHAHISLRDSFEVPANTGFNAFNLGEVNHAISNATSNNAEQSQTTTYTVKNGDTLSKIAEAHGLDDWRDLGAQLGITTEAQARKLAVGAQLEIPVSPSSPAPAPAPAPASTATATAPPTVIETDPSTSHNETVIGYGSEDFGVRQLQRDLNRLGFNAGPADRIFGRKTLKALTKFQEDNGLTPTGFLTDETAELIQEQVAALPPAPAIDLNSGLTDFNEIMDYVLELEGGSKLVRDTGGLTRFGISQNANPDVDIRKLTRGQAIEIYKERYWDAIDADNIPPDMRLAVMDAAVNHGVGKAMSFYAQSGNDPEAFLQLRVDHYQHLAQANPGKYGKYLNGWLNRINHLSDKMPDTQLASADAPATQMASTTVAGAADLSAFTVAANGVQITKDLPNQVAPSPDTTITGITPTPDRGVSGVGPTFDV